MFGCEERPRGDDDRGALWAGLNKYPLIGSPFNVTGNAVLKISFGTTAAGSNLSLCAGSNSDFAVGRCATQLNDSGGRPCLRGIGPTRTGRSPMTVGGRLVDADPGAPSV
jgi:hypothetical protein